jgi:hypothetical protein
MGSPPRPSIRTGDVFRIGLPLSLPGDLVLVEMTGENMQARFFATRACNVWKGLLLTGCCLSRALAQARDIFRNNKLTGTMGGGSEVFMLC